MDLWGRCPTCKDWFLIEDPELDSHYLCPQCLSVAYRWERRDTPPRQRRGGGAA